MKKRFFTPSLIVIFTVLLMFSCGKKEDEVTDQDVSAAADYSYSQKEFDDIFKIGQDAFEANSLKTSNGCPSYSFVGNDSLIIDFGSGCTYNNRVRSGKIKIHYSGKYNEKGSVIKFSLDNYYVNGNQIEGEKTVTNITDALPAWSIKVVNGKITFENQKVSQWNSERVRTFIAGSGSTAILADDEYSVTGTATGISRDGEAYTALITKPLLYYISCLFIDKGLIYPVTGIVDITPEGKLTRTFDFGSKNDCDKISNITIAGKKQVLLLP
ncbi:hypothetical protein MYP_3728 [Sporocytophaga myxococcoides]|uniref:Lipoprotein n=1 Tax=Sporocytophaga myxococcoides TaxID=153721 RepID=A0A098LJ60_9BACT|nr:hypothetical protein [Sporocytophaga myxococcoides]GAL86499.1 hypothetical protein MYP_3728 [Sporocytophaga myxococcoides]